MTFQSLGWWVGTVLMWSVRASLLYEVVSRDGWSGWEYLLLEGTALVLGIMGAVLARRRDYSWGGLGLSTVYVVGVACAAQVEGVPTFGSSCLSLSSLVLMYWALACLGTRFTCGGAAWQRLCDNGPYRWIRHPQQLARVLMLLAIALRSEISVYECLLLLIAIVMALIVVAIEENFLSKQTAYAEYMSRVRWKICPTFF